MTDLTSIAQERLKETKGFILSNNYNVIKVEENYCELEGIITETSINHIDIAHGGYIFGLADTAAAIAAMTNGFNIVTVESHINYFKPGRGKRLVAVAKSIRVGKTISVYEVSIFDDKNDLIAKATMTYFNIDNK